MLEHTKFVHLQALCEVKLSVLAQTQLNVKNEDWETWYNFIEILDFVVKAYRWYPFHIWDIIPIRSM